MYTYICIYIYICIHVYIYDCISTYVSDVQNQQLIPFVVVGQEWDCQFMNHDTPICIYIYV